MVLPHANLRHVVFALILLFGVIYLPGVGHGFIKDDFQWIVDARQPLLTALTDTSGFFRPLVTMSFRANYELFGLDPFPYGLTNLGLAAACAALVFRLGRSFGLAVPAATFGAAVWAFNFHGINMGVLWVSGRTALLLTLFALLAGVAFLAGRRALCLVCVAAALLSKEEAVALPLALLLWGGVRDTAANWWVLSPLPFYAAARVRTNAMVPSNAPDYYTLTFDPLAVARNLLEYLDRSWTFAAAALLLLWCCGRPALGLDAKRYRVLVCGLVWFACGHAITIFLPVRSSLYACFPSVGAAVAAAAVADAWMERMSEQQLRRAAAAAIVVLTALIPVYWARNDRWVEIADLSADTLPAMEACSRAGCDSIVFEDDLSTRRSFTNTFPPSGAAAQLLLGRDVRTSIVPGTDEETGPAADGACVLRIRLIDDAPRPELEGACR